MNTCAVCGGIGQIPVAEVRQGDRRHGRFVMQWTGCRVCVGTGSEVQWTADDLAIADEIGNLEMAGVIRTYRAAHPPVPAPVVTERRDRAFDGPLSGLVRAGWASELSATPVRLGVA